jgi:hypothetical protein
VSGGSHSNDTGNYGNTNQQSSWIDEEARVNDTRRPGRSAEHNPYVEINIIEAHLHSAWEKYEELRVLPGAVSARRTIGQGHGHQLHVWAIIWQDSKLKARLGTDIQPYIITSCNHGIKEVQNHSL